MSYHFQHEHFNKFPQMKPWVGEQYASGNTKRLLMLGESHYLPPESDKSERWYNLNESALTPEERLWTCPSEIIAENIADNFRYGAHSIFKNSCYVINEMSFHYDNLGKIMEHIAFINFFQRPAENTGDSINVSDQDVSVATEVLRDVIRALKPELIVFTSSKASWFGESIARELNIPVEVSPHPGCAWWNREAKKYGGYGRDVIPKFLTQHQWYAQA
ncbi:hypothetical protein VrSk94_00200 [Vibrio rotiferianus]